jgi:dihydrofolate reductase
MTLPRISLIVALDRNRAIGRGGALPWHLPDDLKHFKQQTLGKPILMGRKTFDSIGKALPGRRNLVLSRQTDVHSDWAGVAGEIEVFASLPQALQRCGEVSELMVIGGAQIYEQTLPLASTLWLTEVDTVVAAADAFFPPWNAAQWRESWRDERPADARHAYARAFRKLERV